MSLEVLWSAYATEFMPYWVRKRRFREYGLSGKLIWPCGNHMDVALSVLTHSATLYAMQFTT
jgi:hypothetical protein